METNIHLCTFQCSTVASKTAASKTKPGLCLETPPLLWHCPIIDSPEQLNCPPPNLAKCNQLPWTLSGSRGCSFPLPPRPEVSFEQCIAYDYGCKMPFVPTFHAGLRSCPACNHHVRTRLTFDYRYEVPVAVWCNDDVIMTLWNVNCCGYNFCYISIAKKRACARWCRLTSSKDS